MAIVFLLDVYYCVIVAWTLFYLIATFTNLPGLPWETCGKSVNYRKDSEDGSEHTIGLVYVFRRR